MSDVPINTIICGDCLEVMKGWPDGCVQCVVTSPPYWGLRDYGIEPSVWGGDPACEHEWAEHIEPAANGITHDGGMSGQTLSGNSATRKPKHSAFCQKCGAWRGCYGLEPTPELFVEHTVTIFREVRRVLRDDGTLWLNLGDSYASGKGTCFNPGGGENSLGQERKTAGVHPLDRGNVSTLRESGLKPKDLCGIPWRVAFALQADGWWLRQDIVWHKPNPMPESVSDRCTKAHEYIFLLTKNSRYFFDAEAIREEPSGISGGLCFGGKNKGKDLREKGIRIAGRDFSQEDRDRYMTAGANKRSVWTVPTVPFKEAHFATFPPELIRPCIRAGTSQKGCCPKCGAPWRRVVEKTGDIQASAKGSRFDAGKTGARDGGGRTQQGERYESQTIGWEPTCECSGVDLTPISSPTGERAGDDPSMETGRAGMNRPRGHNEGKRVVTRYEQREYAKQLRESAMREQMEAEAGEAFSHYIRTDASGGRPVPQDLLNAWIGRGWLHLIEIPEHQPLGPVPCVVLDPFGGSGTTGMVAAQEGRDYVMIERNPKYVEMARRTRLAPVETAVPLEEAKTGQLPLFGGDHA